jgi:hypothetical protein
MRLSFVKTSEILGVGGLDLNSPTHPPPRYATEFASSVFLQLRVKRVRSEQEACADKRFNL